MMFFAASDSSIVMTHITAAGASVALINYLKKSPYFPWITKEKAKLLRVVAVITSALGAVGVHYTWHPEARQLIWTLPTVAQMATFGATWVKNFITQELVYQGTSKNGVDLTALKAMLAQAATPPAAKP